MAGMRIAGLIAGIVLVLGWAAGAKASGGVGEISAACVAVGCLPGDGPGFPVEIASPGSYRLTSSLQTGSRNVTAIRILASDVTLDLNGFAIACTLSTGPILPLACFTDGAGVGVAIDNRSLRRRITVANGIVRGHGSAGINLGEFTRIENVTVADNGSDGISVGKASWVANSTIVDNGRLGINASGGGTTILNNTVHGNTSFGFTIGACGYGGNVLRDNNGSNKNPQVQFGTEIGANVCGDDAICP